MREWSDFDFESAFEEAINEVDETVRAQSVAQLRQSFHSIAAILGFERRGIFCSSEYEHDAQGLEQIVSKLIDISALIVQIINKGDGRAGFVVVDIL